MRKLSTEKRVMILSALVEGNSINATCRMTGASKVTVLRLLADAGTFCAQYHNVFVRELKSKRVQLDEIWSFCGCKDKAKQQGAGGHGSVWTWTAIDADSKLCVSYLVGLRDASYAAAFCKDTADRLANRVQLTSDGYKPYLAAVDAAFAGAVDYAMLIKVYGAGDDDHRYSPATCTGCKTEVQSGSPDPEFINTSYVERQNLTLRMSQRRFTRLTNAFSKKIENHEHAVALHYFHYNFIRKHQTLKTTPAVAAGIASKSLTVLDLVTMIEAEEAKLGERLTSYLPAKRKESE
ncbi:IS1 family transposase [Anatilimnocola floriformis]|uniref:IS1 family transposase n=1 Tax=Anatilimnocola floriformis TaxID=2948575 RepID=UPI0028F411B6|nr:IS1 family transposase [Anatilimnocola floriformis]